MAKILIIEDDPASRDVLASAFAAAGYATVEAPDGREGLRLAEDMAPDVVVTDLVMPEVDGMEVIGTLKQRHPRTIIFAVSGQDHHYLRMAELLGADKTFLKPVNPFQVVQSANELLPKRIQ